MIVGTGLLARAFARYAENDDVVIFASGVSNSLEVNPSAFARERLLLDQAFTTNIRHLVYFGSCGVVSQDEEALSPYMRHKKRMEEHVIGHPGGMVLRLPQVVGKTGNPNTLTNFIRDRILADQAFTVWAKAERNLIDIDDIVAIGSTAIDHGLHLQSAINVAADSSTLVPKIVDIFEDVLQHEAHCIIEDKGDPLQIDSSHASSIANSLGIDLGSGYAERVIRKYYGPDSDA